MGWIKVSDHVERYDDGRLGNPLNDYFMFPKTTREEADLAPDIELKTIRQGGNLSQSEQHIHTSMERIDQKNIHDSIPPGIIQTF